MTVASNWQIQLTKYYRLVKGSQDHVWSNSWHILNSDNDGDKYIMIELFRSAKFNDITLKQDIIG